MNEENLKIDEGLIGSQSECILENDISDPILVGITEGDKKIAEDMDDAELKKKKGLVKEKKSNFNVDCIERKKPYEEPTIKIDEEKRQALSAKRIHPVNGYSDHENMWSKIANIDSPNFLNTNKYSNK